MASVVVTSRMGEKEVGLLDALAALSRRSRSRVIREAVADHARARLAPLLRAAGASEADDRGVGEREGAEDAPSTQTER